MQDPGRTSLPAHFSEIRQMRFVKRRAQLLRLSKKERTVINLYTNTPFHENPFLCLFSSVPEEIVRIRLVDGRYPLERQRFSLQKN